jgi:predicted metalloprotease
MELGESEDRGSVEDRRGSKAPLAIGGGIGAIVLALVGAYFGVDLNQFAGNGGGPVTKGTGKADGYKDFSEKILGSTNHVWKDQFEQNRYTHHRGSYEPPKMVLFSESVESEGCGVAPSAVGPFYCPVSKKVFLDPTFFEELETKLGGSKAQFSQAYVIGHEVGHHVQHLLGYSSDKYVNRDGKANAGIRMELQADYLAGVWAHHAKDKLKINAHDIDDALKTARSIGDNRIQEKMKGKSWPESFTHGTDEQRVRNFKQGFDTGDASETALDKFFDPKTPPLRL